MKIFVQFFLIIAVVVLAYLVYESIQEPIRFQEKLEIRQKEVVKKLIAIRSAQVAYNSINGRHTGSFDTLISFIKTAKLPLVKMEGSLSDSLIEAGVTELEALKRGIIKRDTIYISVKDSLFKSKINIDSLLYIPFSKNGARFEMAAATISTGSGVNVQIFECKVANDVYLNGLDKIGIGELNDMAVKMEKYPGLKVGSLTETNNNAGNWE